MLLVRPTRPVRSAAHEGLRAYRSIVVRRARRRAARSCTSNAVLNFLVVALMIALAGQGWNMLGGYGGQYSFGHAAFFGTGAYVDRDPAGALRRQCLCSRFGAAIAAGAAVGAIIGVLSFRAGLRGSYFALVTLAFAEVLRILASVAPITGAGVGTADQARRAARRTSSSHSRATFYLDHSRAGRGRRW